MENPFAQKYNTVRNTKTNEMFKIPAYPKAPPFTPRDRTRKFGGSNKYVSAQSQALNKRLV